MNGLSVLQRYYLSERVATYRKNKRPNRRAVGCEVLAARVLHGSGFASLLTSASTDLANAGRKFSLSVTLATLFGLFLCQTTYMRWSVLVALLVTIGLVAVLLFIRIVTGSPSFFVLVALILGWVLLVIASASREPTSLLWTVVAPIFLSVVVRWAARVGRLAVQLPLFVPAAIVLVLVPMLTQDPWIFVAHVNPGRIVLLAAVAVTPLVVLVARRVRRTSLEEFLSSVVVEISADQDLAESRGTAQLRSRCLTSEHWPERSRTDPFLSRGYSTSMLNRFSTHFMNHGAGSLRLHGVLRLLGLLASTTAITFVINYSITAVAVSPDLIAEWSELRVSYSPAPNLLPGVPLLVPTWPYTGVAALFAVIAAAGLLSLALTDDRYEAAFINVLLREEAKNVMTVGAGYLAMRVKQSGTSTSAPAADAVRVGAAPVPGSNQSSSTSAAIVTEQPKPRKVPAKQFRKK